MGSKGDETRQRILAAASQLFAEKGYHDTTNQDICGLAEANIAAVNYHFGSKEKLYLAVWEEMFRVKGELWDRRVEAAGSAEEALRMFIRMRLAAALDEGPGGWLPRIIHWEMGHPTELHDQLIRRFLEPRRKWLDQKLRELLGPDVNETRLRLAGFCLHSPLIHVLELRKHGDRCPSAMLRESREELIETMQAYALAGLRAVAESQGVTA